MTSLLAHRAFVLFQGARFFSVLAFQMLSVAIAWQVYVRTENPLSLGWVGLAQFAPLALLSPITGDVADRFDRRAIIACCHTVVFGCAVAFFYLTSHPDAPIEWTYAVLVVLGTARAFSAPSGQALVPTLVPAAQLSQGIALGSTTFQIAVIFGPALGGAIIGGLGAPAVFLVVMVLEVHVLLLLASMRYRPEVVVTQRGTGLARLLAGVRYVRAHPVVLGAISLDLFAVLLGGAVALMPIYARDILHVGELGMGALRSAPAVGAGITALVLAFRPLRRRAGATMLAGVGIFGVATITFGLSTSFPLSIAALMVLGAADMVSVVVRQTAVQIATPPEMRGRVAAVNLVFIGASNELGELESGLTAAWLGTVPAVVAGGVGTLIVTALWTFLFPQLRDIDRLEDHAAMSVPTGADPLAGRAAAPTCATRALVRPTGGSDERDGGEDPLELRR